MICVTDGSATANSHVLLVMMIQDAQCSLRKGSKVDILSGKRKGKHGLIKHRVHVRW